MTNKGRVIKRVTQSPVNASQWCFDLECGHEQWVTMKTKPKRKRLFCRTCDAESRTKHDDETRVGQLPKGAYEVVGLSNGHTWIRAFDRISCRDCGLIRREGIGPCKGRTSITMRTVNP